jgi:hypothetical protein
MHGRGAGSDWRPPAGWPPCSALARVTTLPRRRARTRTRTRAARIRVENAGRSSSRTAAISMSTIPGNAPAPSIAVVASAKASPWTNFSISVSTSCAGSKNPARSPRGGPKASLRRKLTAPHQRTGHVVAVGEAAVAFGVGSLFATNPWDRFFVHSLASLRRSVASAVDSRSGICTLADSTSNQKARVRVVIRREPQDRVPAGAVASPEDPNAARAVHAR